MFTQEQMDAAIAEAVEKAIAPLKAKNTELLGETKAEREKRQALETAAQEAEAKRAQEAGEFKTLYEKSQADLVKEREQNASFRGQIKDRDTKAAATALASELTRDTARAGLLTKEAAAFVELGDDGAPVFKVGGIVVDRAKVMDHLKTSYPFLVDGQQSNGGGAPGGGGGAVTKKPEELTAQERGELFRTNPAEFYRLYPHTKPK